MLGLGAKRDEPKLGVEVDVEPKPLKGEEVLPAVEEKSLLPIWGLAGSVC